MPENRLNCIGLDITISEIMVTKYFNSLRGPLKDFGENEYLLECKLHEQRCLLLLFTAIVLAPTKVPNIGRIDAQMNNSFVKDCLFYLFIVTKDIQID